MGAERQVTLYRRPGDPVEVHVGHLFHADYTYCALPLEGKESVGSEKPADSKVCWKCRRAMPMEVWQQIKGPGITIAKCRSCRAEIVWLKTAAGRKMPVDADTVSDGDVLFRPDKHTSHFSTCPHADMFRKRNK